VLALREVEGLSYEEIARATDLPTGTVMSRLYHARRKLAAIIQETPP
jgi:RNA polymerase sigma-70 factor (ECF subfamily)